MEDKSTETNQRSSIAWPRNITCTYDDDGLDKLATTFGLSDAHKSLFKASLNDVTANPYIFQKILSTLGIYLTEGLVGALLFNLACNEKIDLDDILIDSAAMERYLMYNGCRIMEGNKSQLHRDSAELCAKILKHVLLHSKGLKCPSDMEKRYEKTLFKIPQILSQYIAAIKTGKYPNKPVNRKSKGVSPYLLAPIMPKDYPPLGERNQDAFEEREKRCRKLRLRWSDMASPCILKVKERCFTNNVIAHSNNLHVWSLKERRKDLVELPRLTLSELSKHPDNLSIEDVTELREKVGFIKMNYYKSFLNATDMGTEEHWQEVLGHEITSPVLQQVTRASFATYSNPKYKLTFSPWEPKPFWMLRRNPVTIYRKTTNLSRQNNQGLTTQKWRN